MISNSRRTKRTPSVAGIAVGATVVVASLLAITSNAADAHHADVAVVCLAAPATIRITATAWDAPTPEGRVNHAITIAYDGTTIATGEFSAANGYAFSLDYVAPDATGSHTVRATATTAWGPNETIVDIGEVREATIVLPCGPPATVPPPEVLGATVTSVPAAALPIVALPRFTG